MYRPFLVNLGIATLLFLFLPSISYAVVGSVDVTVVGAKGEPVTNVTIKITSIQAGEEGEVSEDETDDRGGAYIWFHEGDSHRVEIFGSDGQKLFDREISLESGIRGIKVDTVSGTVVDINTDTNLVVDRKTVPVRPGYQVKKDFKAIDTAKNNPGILSPTGVANFNQQPVYLLYADDGTSLYFNTLYNYNDTNIYEKIDTTAVGTGFVTTNETKSSFRQNYWNFTEGTIFDALWNNTKIGVFTTVETERGDLRGNGIDNFNQQNEVEGDNDNDKYAILFILAGLRDNWRWAFQAGGSYNDKKNERIRTDSFVTEENSLSDGPLKLESIPLNYHSSTFEGKIAFGKTCGLFDWDLTVGGSQIISGDGNHRFMSADPLGTNFISSPGDLEGFDVNGIFWGTYWLSNNRSIRLWAEVDYNDKEFDGDNTQGTGFFADNNVDVRYTKRGFSSEVGVGFNWQQENGHFATGLSKIHECKQTNVTEINRTPLGTTISNFQNWQNGDTGTWDLIKLQVVAEREVSSDVKLVGGFTTVIGRVEDDPHSEITNFFGNTRQDLFNRGKIGSVNLSVGTLFEGRVATFGSSLSIGYWKLKQNTDGDAHFNTVNTDVFSGKTQCEGFNLQFSADLIF